ncbi:murein biosynthesis integral membrane protein MurJ [Brevibacillus sp. SYP-B805]|uniref:murein biosynthesis integral membrane protein MurJ n=1 Tax=Brevibacillus sp. SYP-B805 TaxID=1578199 RepID=UPI0013ECE88E|nr:murein biosynthesis integral membrane protein MurJ [Brevibacillus sp. SYP-B805]NGQ94428.1 murein biosynthesis integral membrane protein MurJ [Brevibacillus sp. SYP-B805]
MSLVKTASLIVVLTLMGRLLGFFRNVYISNLYGTGMEADAFGIASTIPLTLFLVVPGAINAVLIPTMRGILEKADRQRAELLYQKVLAVVFVGFAALAALGIAFARETAFLFGLEGEKAALTAELLQWMWPSAIFIGLAGLWSSVCNAHQHFFTPTLGTVANGALVLVAIYLLAPVYGVDGLAMATTLGYAAAAVTMLPTLRRFGYAHRLSFRWQKDEALASMGERLVPILIGAVIAQATTFLERGFASALGDGKISALMFANTIAQLPMAVFVGAFTLPLFPLMASYVKRGEMAQMKTVLQKGLAYLLILLVPVTVGLILYGKPLIELVYKRGAFGETAVAWTTGGLVYYSLGLYALAGRDLLTRAFYALEDTRTPVTIGAVGIGIYMLAAWSMIPYLDHGALALSSSVSAFCQMLLLFVSLWRRIGRPIAATFAATAGKVAAASAVMGTAIVVAEPWLSRLPLWLHLAGGISAAALLYGIVLYLCKEALVTEMLEKAWRKRAGRGAG